MSEPSSLREAIPVDRRAGFWLVLPFAFALALGAVALQLFARPVTASQIEACRFVMSEEVDRQAAAMRAHARGEAAPPDEDAEARDVFAACAPLYTDAACRAARSRGKDQERPGERVSAIVTSCRDAYCPKLSPRPALCEADAPRLRRDRYALWAEFDDAVLRHELGARAEPLLVERARGAREIEAAMRAYVEAGSPEFPGTRPGVKVRLGPGSIETRIDKDGGLP